MQPKLKKLVYGGLLSLASLQGIQAQQTAVYKDPQAAYHAAIEFYEQALYGKAEDELGQLLAPDQALYDDWELAELYRPKAELYAALAALRLQRPDAENKLLVLIKKYEPLSVAAQAKLEVGRYYYAQRDYKKAIKYLSSINFKDLNDLSNEDLIEAKFQLAYCYFVSKDFKKAQPVFAQIKGTKSEYTFPANYYYGLCSFFLKDFDAALASFEVANKSSRYEKVVPTYITQIHFMKKDYDKTIAYGEPYTKSNRVRERMTIVQAVGQAYYEKKNYKKALPFMEEYASKTPKMTEDIFYQLAYTQYRAGKYEDAAGNFEQIARLDNKLGQNARYNLADCQLKLGRKEEARLSFKQASEMKQDKELQIDAKMNYAKLSYELGLDNDAISAFMELLNTKYSNESQNLMSQLFLNTRDYEKALSILRTIDRSEPSLKEAFQKVAYFRGVQHYKASNFTKAVERFNESLGSAVHTETTALAHFWKAEALFQLEQFDKSIDEYNRFTTVAAAAPQLPANSSKGTAHYGLGYNYLRKNSYDNAVGEFVKAVKYIEPRLSKINDRHVSNFVYPDALGRAGDCYLYLGGTNNYTAAAGYYERIVANNFPNEDYAMYQLSLIYSLTNQAQKQLRTLADLVGQHPSSIYADDALYAMGSTQINQNEFDQAKGSFDQLIVKYPDSEYTAKALYKLGVLSYSRDMNREALDYFKTVVSNNVQTEEAKAALNFIRKIYIDQGDPDGFMAYASTLQGYNFSDMAADSLLYESAASSFDQENWPAAADNYSKYLDRFPKGLNSMSAHLNRGIAYYNLKEYPKALGDFAYVAEAKNPKAPPAMAEEANLLAGRICYHITEDYAKALTYFQGLEQFASSPENRSEARLFGMRSAYYGPNYQALKGLASNFLKEPNASAANKAEAHFYLAKAQQAAGDNEKAMQSYKESLKLVDDDINASEAHYQIAKITYIQRDLDGALELAFQNNKLLGQHLNWLARNFILIADIYAEQGKLDAAKGTLESLLGNFNGEAEIVKEAQDKLAQVKQAISSNSRLRRNDGNGELEMID